MSRTEENEIRNEILRNFTEKQLVVQKKIKYHGLEAANPFERGLKRKKMTDRLRAFKFVRQHGVAEWHYYKRRASEKSQAKKRRANSDKVEHPCVRVKREEETLKGGRKKADEATEKKKDLNAKAQALKERKAKEKKARQREKERERQEKEEQERERKAREAKEKQEEEERRKRANGREKKVRWADGKSGTPSKGRNTGEKNGKKMEPQKVPTRINYEAKPNRECARLKAPCSFSVDKYQKVKTRLANYNKKSIGAASIQSAMEDISQYTQTNDSLRKVILANETRIESRAAEVRRAIRHGETDKKYRDSNFTDVNEFRVFKRIWGDVVKDNGDVNVGPTAGLDSRSSMEENVDDGPAQRVKRRRIE